MRDIRDESIYPSAESRIHAGLVSDIVSAVARNRPEAAIDRAGGYISALEAIRDALAYDECGEEFFCALSVLVNGGKPDRLVDWVEKAAREYADHTADLLAMEEQ